MKFLLDTDTCVYWLRGHLSVREHLNEIDPQTLAELRYGAAYSERPANNHQAINDFISAITVLGLTPEAVSIFGDVKANLRRNGQLIEDMDLLIAATASL